MRFATLLIAIVLPLAVWACSEGDCAECRDEKCADLLSYCVDADCRCMADCLGNQGIPGVDGCLESCGLTERPAAYVPVEVCVAVACPDSDECAVPASYMPPVTVPDDEIPIEDIGGGDLPDCGFDDSLAHDPEGTVLQLQSADESVCARLERVNDGRGSLSNTSWQLADIRIGPLGGVAHVQDPEQRCWYSSHHNFADWVHVWTGSRRHDLSLTEDGHGGPRTYLLHTFEQGPLEGPCAPLADGTEAIGGPIRLYPVSP